MTIYQTKYNRIFGKQIPTLHSPRGLGIGPAGGVGRLVKIGRFAIKYRKPITGIGAIIAGNIATGGIGLNEEPNQFPKALRPSNKYGNRIRRKIKSGSRRFNCCSCNCHGTISNRR